MYEISLKNEKIQYFLKYTSDSIIGTNFVTNSIGTVQLKNWTIWTYFASAEAFLPKVSLFTKIEADRDQ
jgi:hypothetical protein